MMIDAPIGMYTYQYDDEANDKFETTIPAR